MYKSYYTVVIPTLNEIGNIGRLVRALRVQDPIYCQVLVSDGGSTDQTVEEALEAGARICIGSGSVSDAIVRGISDGRTCSRVVVMDADLSHDYRIVPGLADLLSVHDMVYGYRDSSADSRFNRGISFLGGLGSKFLGLGIKDRMTGFFGVRKSLVKDVQIRSGPKPFLEYLIKSKPSSVAGIPYWFQSRSIGKSKLGRSQILFTGIKQLVLLYISKYSQLVKYVTVGGSGFLLFLGILTFLTEVVGIKYFLSALVGGGISFLYNFTFHKLWTFALDQGISLKTLPNTIWNLGHDNDDGDFDWWEWYSGWPHKKFKRTLGKYIKDLAGDGDVLSLGCGSSPILNMFGGVKVGVDLNQKKLDFFKDHTNAGLIRADVSNIPHNLLNGQKFDIVLCNEVIEHLEGKDLDTTLEAIVHYLREGGRAIISTPDTSSRLGTLVENFLHGDFHVGMLDAESLINRVEGFGLVYVESRNYLWDKIHLFRKREEKSLEEMFIFV